MKFRRLGRFGVVVVCALVVVWLLSDPEVELTEARAADRDLHLADLPSARVIVKMADESTGPLLLESTGDASLDALMTRFDVQAAVPLFNAELGDSVLKQGLGLSRVYALTLSSAADLQDVISAFSADPAVEYAEPDFVGYGAGMPDDQWFDYQWNLHNTGQSSGEPDADVDAPEAWDISVGTTSTVLAIIDTGVDLTHSELAAKVVGGYDFVNGDDVPQDDHDHGTHVAGIAAAITDNGTGMAGVCPGCRIMPLKALNSDNCGYYSWWADAIEYAVDHGADVINMSLGGTEDSQLLHDAVRYAYNADVPIVVAMMNDGNSTPYYPAVFTETIAVGATDRHDDRWANSNFGDHIDLVAPGVSILGTIQGDTYAFWDGTSMATPHVAGVLGLVHSVRPDYTVEELRAILRTTADDQVGPSSEDKKGWDPYFGSGRLNAAQAVQSVVPPAGMTITVCHGGGCDYGNIQDAVDAADDGSVIKVASGTYTGVNDYAGLAQVVYISKSVTIRGGYTTTFADPPDPHANLTTLDAQGNGRVLFVAGNVSSTIEGLRITGGDAAGLGGGLGGGDAGGGVYVIDASATISASQVFSNTARWGGGVYLQGCEATLHGNTLATNSARWGGGAYLENNGEVMLQGNIFAANAAAKDGGGLYLQGSLAVFSGNVITANVAQESAGGLYLYESESSLSGNTITGNAARWGGGLNLWQSDATLNGNVVSANTAEDGGGAYLVKSDAALNNNVVADNQADIGGGGLYIYGSSPHLVHTTIARNGGDGLFVTGDDGNHSTVALTNTILVSHTVGVTATTGNSIRLEATLWGEGAWANATDWGGLGTITTGTTAYNYWGDPAFVAPNAGNYHIGPGSAALDAGVSAGVTTDIDGDLRPAGAGHDVGADEFMSSLRVTQHVAPNPVQTGEQLTYTIRVTNTGDQDVPVTITDFLPDHVTPAGVRTWTPIIPASGGVWAGTVVVAVEVGYTGPLGNVVEVATGEGTVCADVHTAIVTEKVVTIGPGNGGDIVATSASGATMIINVPPDAVAETTQLAYTSSSTVSNSPPGLVFAGHGFSLEAYRDGALHPGLVFITPVTVTISYTVADVVGLDVNTLQLRYWDGDAWSADGITVAERDTAGNRLVVTIGHLSEFATFAQEQRQGSQSIYLPLVLCQ